jgi:SH3 domain/Variant SH3 domain
LFKKKYILLFLDGQISFNAGDIITVKRVQEGEPWGLGELKGKTGWFPVNFVDLTTAVAATTASATPASAPVAASAMAAVPAAMYSSQQQQSASRSTSMQVQRKHSAQSIETVRALYAYEAAAADEISFKTDDVISVVGKDGDWWRGSVAGSAKVGLFPSNYVEKLPETAAAADVASAIRNGSLSSNSSTGSSAFQTSAAALGGAYQQRMMQTPGHNRQQSGSAYSSSANTANNSTTASPARPLSTVAGLNAAAFATAAAAVPAQGQHRSILSDSVPAELLSLSNDTLVNTSIGVSSVSSTVPPLVFNTAAAAAVPTVVAGSSGLQSMLQRRPAATHGRTGSAAASGSSVAKPIWRLWAFADAMTDPYLRKRENPTPGKSINNAITVLHSCYTECSGA